MVEEEEEGWGRGVRVLIIVCLTEGEREKR